MLLNFLRKTLRSDFPLLLYFQVDGDDGCRITYCYYYPTIQRLVVNCDFCNIREILKLSDILEIFEEESLWNRNRIDYLRSCLIMKMMKLIGLFNVIDMTVVILLILLKNLYFTRKKPLS